MRAMILGAGGMLGHDLVTTTPNEIELFPFIRAQLDITDARSLASAVARVSPDFIINAAAYTAVDRSESEPQLAFRVNGEAVGELGRVAQRAGARVVHFSTDYVFDGTAAEPYEEESRTNPINTYGASKLAGETALRESGADFLILRTQWLFGVHGRSFPHTMWERARQGVRTKVVTDQVGSPSYTRDMASAAWVLAERGASGVVHLANAGSASRYDVARRVFGLAGKEDLVAPCASDEYPTRARRPRYTVLCTLKAERLLARGLPSWFAALDLFLAELNGTGGNPS
jgi:dTDP-4-dehydrorhamnose reductase